MPDTETIVDLRRRDREQAGHVSYRRVGGLFVPHRRALTVVVLVIVVSSLVSMTSPRPASST